MSAYLVSTPHISAIVRWACVHDVSVCTRNPSRRFEIPYREQEVAQILHNEYVKSVNYRYDESNEPERIVYDDFATSLNAIEVIKACNCLEYQRCEHVGWDANFAKAIVDAVVNAATRELPGYGKAAWEIKQTQPSNGLRPHTETLSEI